MNPPEPGVTVCGYCKRSANGLAKFNNKLLHLMRQHDASYDRNTVFCVGCRARAEAKLERRERNANAVAKVAKRSAGNETSSYSNASGHFLSDSTSTSSGSSKRKRPSRNVGKRTGGRPAHREDNSDDDSTSDNGNSSQSQQADNQQDIPLFQVPTNSNSGSQQSNSQSNSSSANQSGSDQANNQQNIPIFQRPATTNSSSSSSTQSDHRSVVANIEYANDTDNEQNGNGSAGSSESAPLHSNRSQRTETPRELTPERMRNLTPQERSQEFQKFCRGGGG